MLPLMLGVDITVDIVDMTDTVDTDTADTVADIMARDPLMLNLSLMPLPITVDTTVLVDTTVVTDMADLDTTAVDTMDVKGGPLKVMPKPTMVDITDTVDTVDTADMVMADMATTDKCHLSSQIFMDQVTR